MPIGGHDLEAAGERPGSSQTSGGTGPQDGSGSGTEDDPYIVKSAATLVELLGEAGGLSAFYELHADLDLSNLDDWTPIGIGTAGFSGVFDGSGYSVHGLEFTTKNNEPWGLFATIAEDGVVRNLGIEDADLRATGEAKEKGVLAAVNKGRIEQCFATGTVAGAEKLGGLVGLNGGEILQSYAVVRVDRGTLAGGLVGDNDGGGILESYAAGLVEEDSGGALAGRHTGGTIERTFFDSDVNGDLPGVANDPEHPGVTALTNLQATSAETFTDEELEYFVDFDLDTVWAMDEELNGGYPYLRETPPSS